MRFSPARRCLSVVFTLTISPPTLAGHTPEHPFCSVCAASYYKSASGACKLCMSNIPVEALIIFALIIALIAGFAATVTWMKHKGEIKHIIGQLCNCKYNHSSKSY